MNNPNHLDEVSLLAAFYRGDNKAFEQIYNLYWFNLYCIALKQLRSKQDAEEMIQVLFEKIWTKRNELVINHIGPYLTTTLHHLIIDFVRKNKTKDRFLKNYEPKTTENTTEIKIFEWQLQKDIEMGTRALPEKTQTVFRLSRTENKTTKEIAEILHISEKTVEYHITKAIRELKGFLKKTFTFF